MRNIVIALAVAFLSSASARSDHRPLASLPDHFVIARHTFFDFGPPNNYYELFLVRPNSTGASVERISLTPKIDACRNPRLEIQSGTIATNPGALLGKTNPCAIPEKDLNREFKRCKKCLTFSGAFVTMQVECGAQTRTIRSKVLDRDMFDPRADTPEHTSWTQGLLAQLDASVGPGVMDKPMFQTSESDPPSLINKDAPELQDIAAGKYDSLFQAAPDKLSDLYRALEATGIFLRARAIFVVIFVAILPIILGRQPCCIYHGPCSRFCSSFPPPQQHRKPTTTPRPKNLASSLFPSHVVLNVQQQFDRGVALLHSFAYADARSAFQAVTAQDEHCAMAHWGIAMTYFRQLWDPPILPETVPTAQKDIERAQQLGTNSERERSFIEALAELYKNADSVPYTTRALNYERAMSALVSQNSADVEAKVFYALALLANASPTDKTHSKQKQAATLLEPLYRSHPQHPGIPHYLIHAYDNAELAPQGLQAAKAYAQIAPSAPHALHMPSHIFTRLGLWDDSIASNLAAMKAARQQGDTGEELHAMDYLVYAYLQSGRDSEANQIAQQLQGMSGLNVADFKIGYAYTVMPIRLAVERGDWAGAAKIVSPERVPSHVAAIAVWARGMGLSRSGHVAEAQAEADRLQQIETHLRASSQSL